jgi:hypothetical protein
VSKRHQTNRRKSFSRRQHELRERPDRRALPDHVDATWDEAPTGSRNDSFGFIDARAPGMRFALGD